MRQTIAASRIPPQLIPDKTNEKDEKKLQPPPSSQPPSPAVKLEINVVQPSANVDERAREVKAERKREKARRKRHRKAAVKAAEIAGMAGVRAEAKVELSDEGSSHPP